MVKVKGSHKGEEGNGLGKETIGKKKGGLYSKYFNGEYKQTFWEKTKEKVGRTGLHVGEIYLFLISLILWSGILAIIVGYWDSFLIMVMIGLALVTYIINMNVKRDKLLGVKAMSNFKKGLHVFGIFLTLCITILFVNDHIKYTKLAFAVQQHNGSDGYTQVNRCSGYGSIKRCVQDKDGNIRIYTIEGGSVTGAKKGTEDDMKEALKSSSIKVKPKTESKQE